MLFVLVTAHEWHMVALIALGFCWNKISSRKLFQPELLSESQVLNAIQYLDVIKGTLFSVFKGSGRI